ncbi:MAG: hypothetical protein ACOYXN_10905 [Acidobacteriota bacterium]
MARRWFLAGSILLAGSLSLAAQTLPPPPDPPDASVGRQRREVGRLYVVQRMRETLGLSDAQTLKVMDSLKAMEDLRSAHQTALRTMGRTFEAHVQDPGTPEKDLREDVAQFRSEQERFEAALKAEEGRLMEALTPRQQVQFLLLRRQLLERLADRGPAAPRRGRGGGPEPLP